MRRVFVFMLLVLIMLPVFCKWEYGKTSLKDEFGDIIKYEDVYSFDASNSTGGFSAGFRFYFENNYFSGCRITIISGNYFYEGQIVTIKLKEENGNIISVSGSCNSWTDPEALSFLRRLSLSYGISFYGTYVSLDKTNANSLANVFERNKKVKLLIKEYDGVSTVDCSDFTSNFTCIKDGHKSYANGKITKEPTCTNEGTKTYSCEVCGKIAKTESIPAKGHDFRYYKNNKTGEKYCMCANCKEQMHIGAKGPAGGFIFYDCDADNNSGNKDGLKSYECGWRYLEAAPADLPKEYVWGDDGDFGTKTGIGEGKNNTKIIVEKASKERTENAATACNAYSLNGYSDWFLPSKDELNLMYVNLENKGIGHFISVSERYWSSCEDSDDAFTAWGWDFRNGNSVTRPPRDDYNYVRPCRAF